MEDLAGLNFSVTPQPQSTPPNQTRSPHNQATNYVSPIPSRGGLSPNYMIASSSNGGSLPHDNGTTPATKHKIDSFASLSAFSGISTRQPASLSNASLEQQRLAKEKEKKSALEKEKQNLDIHFGADEFWEKHSRQRTPSIVTTDTYFPFHSTFFTDNVGIGMLI